MSWGGNPLGTCGRLAVLGLVLWAWAGGGGAGLPAGTNLFLLWDDSPSARLHLPPDLGEKVAAACRQLPAGSRVTVVRFASEPRVAVVAAAAGQVTAALLGTAESGAGAAGGEVPGTDIAAALALAVTEHGGKGRAALLLISDGQETAGSAEAGLQALSGQGVAVWALDPAALVPARDAEVRGCFPADSVPAGRPARFTAYVHSTYPTPATATFWVDGRRRESLAVDLFAWALSGVQHSFEVPAAGTVEVRVRLDAPGDLLPGNDECRQVLEVQGRAAVLYLTRDLHPGAALGSLRAGGWPVTAAPPSALEQMLAARADLQVVVLDDVAAWEVTAEGWAALDRKARAEGLGVVVLGGPRSFGRGGYHGTQLEDLLPVSSTAAGPADGVAVEILLDLSGSMGERATGPTPVQLGTAVLGACASLLQSEDRAGVIAFDVAAREVLGLTPPARLLAEVGRISSLQPAGGTRLAPGIALALDRLAQVDRPRRVLVLLSDGQWSDTPEELAAAGRQIARSGTVLVPMAIGTGGSFDALAGGAGVDVLRVGGMVEVPEFLRRPLTGDPEEAAATDVPVRVLRPLPFLPADLDWPALLGFAPTGLREGAALYLQSDTGHPLLAAHRAGTGRVVALPAGLGPWARPWVGWERWGELVGGLMEWVRPPNSDPLLGIAVEEESSGAMALEVEALTAEGRWSPPGAVSAGLTGPGGKTTELRLRPVAPGLFRTPGLPLGSGLHLAHARAGDRVTRRRVQAPAAGGESPDLAPGAEALAAWERKGLVSLWDPGMPLAPALRGDQTAPRRTLLLGIAAAVYLLTLAAERLRPPRGR